MRISLAQMTQLMVVIPIVVYVFYITVGWNPLYWVGQVSTLHSTSICQETIWGPTTHLVVGFLVVSLLLSA